MEARPKTGATHGVDQAKQAELSAKNTYVNALAAYRNSLDQFKIKLACPWRTAPDS